MHVSGTVKHLPIMAGANGRRLRWQGPTYTEESESSDAVSRCSVTNRRARRLAVSNSAECYSSYQNRHKNKNCIDLRIRCSDKDSERHIGWCTRRRNSNGPRSGFFRISGVYALLAHVAILLCSFSFAFGKSAVASEQKNLSLAAAQLQINSAIGAHRWVPENHCTASQFIFYSDQLRGFFLKNNSQQRLTSGSRFVPVPNLPSSSPSIGSVKLSHIAGPHDGNFTHECHFGDVSLLSKETPFAGRGSHFFYNATLYFEGQFFNGELLVQDDSLLEFDEEDHKFVAELRIGELLTLSPEGVWKPGPGATEQFNVFAMEVRAYDSAGRQFDSEDMRLMNTCGQVTGQANGIQIACFDSTARFVRNFRDFDNNMTADEIWTAYEVLAKNSSSIYLIGRALTVGTYSVATTIQNSDGTQLVSNAVSMEVFEHMTVVPERLVLMPGGSSYELMIKGGPSDNAIHFDTELVKTPGLVELDWIPSAGLKTRNRILRITTSKRQGEATLLIHAKFFAHDAADFVVAKIPIIVDVPYTAAIRQVGPPGKSHVPLTPGVWMPLITELTTKKGQSFTPVVASQLTAQIISKSTGFFPTPLCRYKWTADNFSLLSTQPTLTKAVAAPDSAPLDALESSQVWAVTATATSKASGSQEIKVKVICGASVVKDAPFKFTSTAIMRIEVSPSFVDTAISANILDAGTPSFHQENIVNVLTRRTQELRVPDAPAVYSLRTHCKLKSVALHDFTKNHPLQVACFGNTECSELEVLENNGCVRFVPTNASTGLVKFEVLNQCPKESIRMVLSGACSEHQQSLTTFAVTLETSQAAALRPIMSTSPLTLSKGTSIPVRFNLIDVFGRVLLLPDRIAVTVISSHPSIAEGFQEVTADANHQDFSLLIRGNSNGCASIQIRMELPSSWKPSAVIPVCVGAPSAQFESQPQSEKAVPEKEILSLPVSVEISPQTARPWEEILAKPIAWLRTAGNTVIASIVTIIAVILIRLVAYLYMYRVRRVEPFAADVPLVVTSPPRQQQANSGIARISQVGCDHSISPVDDRIADRTGCSHLWRRSGGSRIVDEDDYMSVVNSSGRCSRPSAASVW